MKHPPPHQPPPQCLEPLLSPRQPLGRAARLLPPLQPAQRTLLSHCGNNKNLHLSLTGKKNSRSDGRDWGPCLFCSPLDGFQLRFPGFVPFFRLGSMSFGFLSRLCQPAHEGLLGAMCLREWAVPAIIERQFRIKWNPAFVEESPALILRRHRRSHCRLPCECVSYDADRRMVTSWSVM